jgi:hypothetical protein
MAGNSFIVWRSWGDSSVRGSISKLFIVVEHVDEGFEGLDKGEVVVVCVRNGFLEL